MKLKKPSHNRQLSPVGKHEAIAVGINNSHL